MKQTVFSPNLIYAFKTQMSDDQKIKRTCLHQVSDQVLII